ncbi:MAG: dehydrogenase, partial [Blastocatellia bacterium]
MEWLLTGSRIQTAIIGAGFVGRVHIEAVRRIGWVDVAAIADVNRESAQRLADGFGIDRATGDVAELLKDPAIDTVHICAPNALHYDLASAALNAGKHVLCEKPLAISSEQALSLVRLASD